MLDPKLDPTKFFQSLDSYLKSNKITNYITLRRIISMIYFSLSNYIATEAFYRNKYTKEDINANEIRQIIIDCDFKLTDSWNFVSASRNLVDHHLQNPSNILGRNLTVDFSRLIKTLNYAITISNRIKEKLTDGS